jgi:hypothetical protein
MLTDGGMPEIMRSQEREALWIGAGRPH